MKDGVLSLSEIELPPPNVVWGRWTLQMEALILVHEFGYEVPLNECQDSAKTLDWIAQVALKTWAKPDDIGYLVRALDELIGLQENVCGMGQHAVLVRVRDVISRRRGRPDTDDADN